jgi:hypothetical protein
VGQWTFVYGAAWDIQWHLQVGRDRPLTPPHLALLGGIALTGAAALIAIPAFTLAARRGADGPTRQRGWWKLGPVAAPPGVSLAGAGALLSALAFPLDNYWHGIYGLDVTIWAPFRDDLGMALAAQGTYAFALWRGALGAGRPGALCILATAGAITQSSEAGLFRTWMARRYSPSTWWRSSPSWLVAAPACAVKLAPLVALACWRCGGSWKYQCPRRSASRRYRGLAVGGRAGLRRHGAGNPGVVMPPRWWISLVPLPRPAGRERGVLAVPWRPDISGTRPGASGLAHRPWQQTIPLTRLGPDVALGAAFNSTLPLLALSALAGALVGVGLGAALRRTQT